MSEKKENPHIKDMLKDTKRVIRSRKSEKKKQHNDQILKYKDIQNTTQKNDGGTRTPQNYFIK
jgi:hypothetical protein